MITIEKAEDGSLVVFFSEHSMFVSCIWFLSMDSALIYSFKLVIGHQDNGFLAVFTKWNSLYPIDITITYELDE